MSDDEEHYGFDPLSENVRGGKRNYYDDDSDLKKQQKAKDRKVARKQAKVDAKAQRIQMHEQWAKKKQQERADKEEASRRAKRAKEGKRRYDEQKALRHASPDDDEMDVPTKKAAKAEAAGRKRGREDKETPAPAVATEKPKKEKKVTVKTPAEEVPPPAVAAAAPLKYVVPGRRGATERTNKAGGEVRGMINRLSLENVVSVAQSISELYSMGRFPRHDVISSVCEELSKNCFRNTHLTANSALTYAGMIRAMQLDHTSDAIADIVAHTCDQLEDTMMTGEGAGTIAVNCGMMIGYFHLVNLCDAALPLTLLEDLLRSVAEDETSGTDGAPPIGVEVALAVLRCCGMELRQKAPVALNRIVNQVHTNQSVSRHRVLLDLIKNIAAGKKAAARTDFQVDASAVESILNQLGEVVRRLNKGLTTKAVRKAVETNNVLGVSYSHCTDPSKPPRWHQQKHDLFAARGQKRDYEDSDAEKGSDDNASEAGSEEGGGATARKKADIERIREKEKALAGQRFGTETKRAIFDCITSATDEQECFHMLVRRDPSGAQVGDVAAVLLQCIVQEASYNEYYAEVLHRFVSSGKKLRTAIQFALWDRFKVIRIQPVDITGYLNLSCLLAYLFNHDLYPLSLLRGLDLHVDSRNINLFTRIMLLRLMMELKPQKIAPLFFGGDVSKGELADVNISTTTLRKALKKFFHEYFVAEDEAGRWIPQLFEVVTHGIEAESENSLIDALPGRIEMVRRALRDGV